MTNQPWEKEEQPNGKDIEPRIVGFICNWGAYSGLEMAGINGTEYPSCVSFIRVMCLGRLNLGLILKTFELGADGVIMLGCPPGNCHYETGAEHGQTLLNEARKVLELLGINPKRLALAEVPTGRDDILAKELTSFVKYIKKERAGKPELKVSATAEC